MSRTPGLLFQVSITKMFDIDPKKFEELKAQREEYYKSIHEVECPYFGKEKVAFNAKGIEHLKFKEKGKARSRVDQYIRLKLLDLAPKVLGRSHTVQEFFETIKFEQMKSTGKWQSRAVKVRYYGFVAIIGRGRVKIIVKEVDGGNKFFWSIIPFWRQNQKNAGQKQKIFHLGDPETD